MEAEQPSHTTVRPVITFTHVNACMRMCRGQVWDIHWVGCNECYFAFNVIKLIQWIQWIFRPSMCTINALLYLMRLIFALWRRAWASPKEWHPVMCNQLYVHYILLWCFHNVLLMIMLPWQHLRQWQFRHVHSPTLSVVLEVYSTFSPGVPAWAFFVHMSGAYLWNARVDRLDLDLVINKSIMNSQSVNRSWSCNW